MHTSWRVYKSDTLAAKLDRSELPGFFGKKVVVGLNEAALIVRDGKPETMVTESHQWVPDVLEHCKSLLGLGADISVYFVDLAPFDLTLFLGHQDTQARIAHVTAQAGETQPYNAPGPSANDAATPQIGKLQRAAQWIAAQARRVGWSEPEQGDAERLVHHGQLSTAVARQDNISKVCVVALSSDREVINASCRLRLHVAEDKMERFMALLKGKRALATWDLAVLLRDEFFAKVLVPEISYHSAADLRGNRVLLMQLQRTTREALEGTLNDVGLVLTDFCISWGLTDQERQEITRQRVQREEQALDFAKNRHVAQLMRVHDVQKTRIANLQQLKIAQATGDNEYRKLLLASALERDDLVQQHRIDVARFDAQIQALMLEAEKNEAQVRLEKRRAEEELRLNVEDRRIKQQHESRLAGIAASDKEMWSMVHMQIEMATQKHEREMARRRHELEDEWRKMQADIEDRYQQRKLKLEESMARMGMIERLVSQGLNTGHADANVLNTMLKQATEQEYATTNDMMVRSRASAQAAGNDVETYRQAQADERAHQRDMTGLAGHLMGAAKQSPPGVLVPGVTASSLVSVVVPNAMPAASQVVTGQPASLPEPPGAESARVFCPNPSCQNAVQPGMNFCPFCGSPLTASAS